MRGTPLSQSDGDVAASVSVLSRFGDDWLWRIARTEPCWRWLAPRDASPVAASDLQTPIGPPVAERHVSRDSISVSQRLQREDRSGTAVFDHPFPAGFCDSHFPHAVPTAVNSAVHESASFQTTQRPGPACPTTDRGVLVKPDRRAISDERPRLASYAGNGNQHATGRAVQTRCHRNLVGSGHEQVVCNRK